jgi:hypothetical protein
MSFSFSIRHIKHSLNFYLSERRYVLLIYFVLISILIFSILLTMNF